MCVNVGSSSRMCVFNELGTYLCVEGWAWGGVSTVAQIQSTCVFLLLELTVVRGKDEGWHFPLLLL